MKGMLVCTLVATLLVAGMAWPLSKPDGDIKQVGVLPGLLARREAVKDAKDTVARREQNAQTRTARMERLTHLSEDEREFMSKQIMQAISEMVNSDCMSDRDYQGWVDFGRRSAE